MTIKNRKSIYLQVVTMIDLAMGYMEICTVPSAQTDLVSLQVELVWLTMYQLPSKVIVDCGNEFLAELKTIAQTKYSI